MASIFTAQTTDTNVTGYSVTEDATPLDPSDTTGGVGQIQYELAEIYGPEGSVQLLGLDVNLSDPYRGETSGKVTEVSGGSGLATITADSKLGALVGTVTAKPMVGTFQDVVLYYLSLANITDGIIVDSELAFTPVAVPGFSDELWLRLKQLCGVHQAEIAYISDKVVIRPIRNFVSNTQAQTDFSWDIQKGDAAQNIEVTYYGNNWVENTLVYPYTDDERDNMQSWQVDTGKVVEDDVSVSISLATLNQPQCALNVPSNYGADTVSGTQSTTTAPPTSVYSVFDASNNAITPQSWTTAGGKLEVSINDDTKSFHIKLTGPTTLGNGPFRIVGRTTGSDGDDYPSLFLGGSGVYVNPQVLTVTTGVNADITVTETGTTIEVESVATLEDAYRVGMSVAAQWTGTKQTISGTLSSINQIGKTGSVDHPDFAAFDASETGKLFSDFNSAWSGKTFKDFDATQTALVEDNFENQTFGNVAGARLPYGYAMYRITDATITDENIQFNATADTTFADYDEGFTGKTFADFNTLFAGKSFSQFDRIPLNDKPSSQSVVIPATPTGEYPNMTYPDVIYPADAVAYPLVVMSNEDGTSTVSGTNVVDNGDGTFTISGPTVTDNGDGTFTITSSQ